MVKIFNYPINFNISSVSFNANPHVTKPVKQVLPDEFFKCPIIERYINKDIIELRISQNPRIKEILDLYNLPVKINEKAIKELNDKDGHLRHTRNLAGRIYSMLDISKRKGADMGQLQEAAMLHDIGKVLIPEKILNKKGALTEKEREIMELHPELGYELLKNNGMDLKTLNLIRNHHQNITKTGYPAVDDQYVHNTAAQVLSIADKYCALVEERCYKAPMDPTEALEKIYKEDVITKKISQDVSGGSFSRGNDRR